MPFPLIPLLISAISSVAGAGAAKLMNRGGAAPTNPSDVAKTSLLESEKQARELAARFTGLGTAAVQPALDYWSSILGGNRARLMELYGPEVERIGGGYDAARRTLLDLTPRGGGRATMLSELPFQRAQDVTSLFLQGRPAAAAKLGELGPGLLANAVQALYASTGAGRAFLEQELLRRQQNIGLGKDIGRGIFEVIKWIVSIRQGSTPPTKSSKGGI